MLLVQWLFDKLGYMPKISIDTTFPFSATQQEYVAPDFEKPVKKAVKKPALKKATTRKKKA